MKTNKGLVEYAKQQLGKPYWYGCYGQKSNKELYSFKKRQYPSQYMWACPRAQLGVKVHDCVGLIKGYLWCDNPDDPSPRYNSKQDVSANGMLERCKVKGKFNEKAMPDVPGILVFLPGHVGVYIGDGKVIEAKGHKYGVVKTNLKGRGWKSWGYCPYIEYIKNEPKKEENVTKPSVKSNTPKVTYFPKYEGKSGSIADALDSLHYDGSYKYRKKIAQVNGIKGYIGSPSQNTKLLNLLKKGKLIKP